MTRHPVQPAALSAAVALLTAQSHGIDADRDDLIGDVDPLDVIDALVLLGSVLATAFVGLPGTGAGLRSAGTVAAWAGTYAGGP